MYPLNQLKTLVSCGRDPARSLPFRRGFLLIPLILVAFALCQQTQAAPNPETPDPGAKPLSNTADGQGALQSVTSGLYNSAFGFLSVLSNTNANFNTGIGAGALLLNNANENTAVGAGALFSGTVANSCNAVGALALAGVGPTPPPNTGTANNAFGVSALEAIETGSANTAVGDAAGAALVDGSFNIYIGFGVGSDVAPDESETIRIGDTSNAACFIGGIANAKVSGDPVVVTANAHSGLHV